MESYAIKETRPFLSRFITESTIPERHARRQLARVKAQRSTGITPRAVTIDETTLNSLDQLSDQYDTVMTFESASSTDTSRHQLPGILMASFLASISAEGLCGTRAQSPFPKVANHLISEMGSNSGMNDSILLWHQHQHQLDTLSRNRKHLTRVVFAAFAASLTFGVKYGVMNGDTGNGDFSLGKEIFSSSVAGACRAAFLCGNSLAFPASVAPSQSAYTYIRNSSFIFLDSCQPSLLLSIPYEYTRSIFKREILRAVVCFGTYETVKQALTRNSRQVKKDGLMPIIVSGSIAGAASGGLMYSMVHGTGPGLFPSMIRAIPTHAVLFSLYECILSSTTK